MKALEMIKNGANWNGKFYGVKTKSIYLNGEKIELTPEEVAAIQDFIILEKAEYEFKEINGRKIIGFFHLDKNAWQYLSEKHVEQIAKKMGIQFQTIEETEDYWMVYDKAFILK